jgi:hypothetical protein
VRIDIGYLLVSGSATVAAVVRMEKARHSDVTPVTPGTAEDAGQDGG